jgi:hypothetical protein
MRAVTLLAVACAALVAGGAASATPEPKPRVTLIGDSIAASFDYVPSAREYLGKGLDLRTDAMVCRRLVASSCVFQGTQPATVLDLARSHGRALGPVVVVNVGYNDWAAVYSIDKVMHAFTAAKVRTVVWVTLRESTSNYAQINSAIRKAARRWPNLVLADWDAYSRGKPWFISDGLHLTPTGAKGLSRMLRPIVLAWAEGS